MTYWSDVPDYPKDMWHWLGVALSTSERVQASKCNKPLWKPHQWSCFMRDRLIAMSMGRPARVREKDLGVSELTLEDFELESSAECVLTIGSECNAPIDLVELKEIANLCIEKARLCICIGHVLRVGYTARDQYPRETTWKRRRSFQHYGNDAVEGIRLQSSWSDAVRSETSRVGS